MGWTQSRGEQWLYSAGVDQAGFRNLGASVAARGSSGSDQHARHHEQNKQH